MSEPRYQIVFSGTLRPGFTEEQVKQNLKQQLKLSDKAIISLFSTPKSIIKRHLNFAAAHQYEQQFFLQGMVVKQESMVLEEGELLGSLDSGGQTVETNDNAVSVSHFGGAKKADGASQMDDDKSVYPKVLPFEFRGNGKEYFKIWIVNIVLTIITLGIYSAWAKVRNKQYFYGNTHLEGSSFEYTAKPIQILKGRLLAFLVIALYYGISSLLPPQDGIVFSLVAALLFIIILPWVVVMSLRFNARHSSYRNINFAFDGKYWGAFKAFILWPLAGITVFLIPFGWHRKNRFFVNNSRYGIEPFQFSATVGDYYRIFGMMIALGLGLGLAAMLLMAVGGFLAVVIPVLGYMVMGLAYAAVYFILGAYFACSTKNLLFNSTLLKTHSLSSDYDVKSYALLLLTNTLGIVLTLGFFIPWAMVRAARYHAEKTHFVVSENLSHFIAAEKEQVNSVAEGFADAHDWFNIDVGI